MKQGLLPKQQYTLINMCMQGVENGIAYSCSDCGRFAILLYRNECNGLYQGHTSCIETKYKSVFNGLKY